MIQSTNGHHHSTDPATKLRQLISRDGIVFAPGVFDGITARAAVQTGFDCLYVSGAAVTASRLGLPDLGFVGIDDFVEIASMMAEIPDCPPLICDADTGFGGAAQIARMVQRYHRAGIAGFHIEDQIQTKRCGHLLGKQLVSEDEFVSRIRAAKFGRDSVPGGSSIVVIARTDAVQLHGIDAAIQRMKSSVEAGADVAFVEGVESEDQVRQVVTALSPIPVLVNLVHGGVTPSWTAKQVQEMGAKLAIMPGASLKRVAEAALMAYSSVKSINGEDGCFTSPTLSTPRAFFEFVGLKEAVRADAAAGGKLYSNGV